MSGQGSKGRAKDSVTSALEADQTVREGEANVTE